MHVSQKVVIKNKEGKILALRKSGVDRIRPNTWDLPGGQVEEGENLQDSARREIREETGLEVTELAFVDADARNARNGEYWVVLFYTARAESSAVTLSDEHDQYEWISREDFLKRTSSDRLQDLLQRRTDI